MTMTWEETRNTVFKRDGNICRLVRILSAKDYLILQRNAKHLLTVLDPAHVIARSRAPNLVYDPNNVVLLNRYSHEMLDSCCNPIDGKRITLQEREEWWMRIVGKDIYTNLIEGGIENEQ